MELHVALVILNWNGKKFLEDFLPGVIEHSKKDAEVIVADNASTDGSVEFLQSNFPSVRIILNESNGGYAKGYNDALKQIEADYFILLNSDIEVTPGWIKPVIELLESDPKIAAAQPKLRSYYEREKFEYAGAAGGFVDSFGYPFCRGRLFQSLETDTGQYDDIHEVFWATGACLFIKASVFIQLGGFDERFFAHMEEIDLCWRAKNKGYRIMFCPDSVVYHVGGGTLPKKSWRKTHLNIRNNIIMLYKNLPDQNLIPVFFIRLFLDGIASLKFLVDGGFRDFFAVILAHWQFYKLYPQLKRERRKVIHYKVTKVYKKNLVFEYFLRRKKKFTDLEPGQFS
ncbi:MAG: glycosyltransferase family 2 protein [Bacteroidales bacterium]|nr:glycosyltransferase family 2 protein [Bacteroidales bacterium]MCF8402864.1 glycosyltransferase family 2 protein [Bacteroidales bacterium]